MPGIRFGDTACVFFAGLHRAERAIAERLLTLNKGKLPWPSIDPGKAIPWIERHIGLTLPKARKLPLTDEQWKKDLTPEQYEVANERVFHKGGGKSMTLAQAAQRAI